MIEHPTRKHQADLLTKLGNLMRNQVILLLVIFCLSGCAFAVESHDSFTLYLVRHAEKQSDGTRDPALTEAGIQRATQLAAWLTDKGITDIHSSDYKRTRGTAQPLATMLEIELNIYDPSDLPALATQLKSTQHNAYVVGHSNTTPGLARLLCNCEIADMDESEYDRLIEISIDGDTANARILKQGDLF